LKCNSPDFQGFGGAGFFKAWKSRLFYISILKTMLLDGNRRIG